MRIPRLKLGLTVLGSAAVLAAGATAGIALGSPTRSAGGSPVTQAFEKTSKAASGHFSFTFSVAGGSKSSTGAISIGGTGGFDTKHKASQFKLDLGALSSVLGSASGGGSIPQSIDVVSLNNVIYLHIPALAKQQPGGAGKEWLKIDLGTLPKSVTKGVNAGQVGKIDPTKALATLTASIAVHKIGSATVRGSSTTHYRATLDITKAVTGLLPKAQQASTLKSLKSTGLTTLPIDVYIDGSGYVRRVAVALKNLKSKGSPPSSFTLSFDLYDFGTAVHVSAPPANKTVDGSKLLSGLSGLAGPGG